MANTNEMIPYGAVYGLTELITHGQRRTVLGGAQLARPGGYCRPIEILAGVAYHEVWAHLPAEDGEF